MTTKTPAAPPTDPAAAVKAAEAKADPFSALGDSPTAEEVLAAAKAAAGIGIGEGEAEDEAAGAPSGQDPRGEAGGGAGGDEGEVEDEGAPAGGRLLAGRYKTSADLKKGVEELREHLGLQDVGSIEGMGDAQLERAYLQLRKTMGAKGAGSLKTGDAPKGADGKPAAAADGAPAWKELDEAAVEQLGAEWYANKGDLKPETYARLEKDFKIKPVVARAMAENMIAQAEAQNLEIVSDAGFKDFDQFNAARAWAGEKLPAAQIFDLDAMLADRSPMKRGAAVRTLKALYDRANPPAKKRIVGSPDGTTALKPITSQAEYLRAMDDPLFYDDSQAGTKYRKEVLERAKAGGFRA